MSIISCGIKGENFLIKKIKANSRRAKNEDNLYRKESELLIFMHEYRLPSVLVLLQLV